MIGFDQLRFFIQSPHLYLRLIFVSFSFQHENIEGVAAHYIRGPAETWPGKYLVMRYYGQGSLQSHLLDTGGSGLPNYRDRLRIARGLAEGLVHLHSKRIFHRDVKPDNVLLTASLDPRLAEFSVSKAVNIRSDFAVAADYETAHIVGTLGYTAPEAQFFRSGPKTDVYALGIVLLQLATGLPAVAMAADKSSIFIRNRLVGRRRAAASSNPAVPQSAASQSDPRCIWPPDVLGRLLTLGLRCSDDDPFERFFAHDISQEIGILITDAFSGEPKCDGATTDASLSAVSSSDSTALPPPTQPSPDKGSQGLDMFDVVVALGENVQAAVDGSRPGGSVLLLPGSHAGPLVLGEGTVVNVFGRGLATLETARGAVVTSAAAVSCIDGLVIRADAHASGSGHHAVLITSGRLRVQNCDVSCKSLSCIKVEGRAADPLVIGCKIHLGSSSGVLLDNCRGAVVDCKYVSNVMHCMLRGFDECIFRRAFLTPIQNVFPASFFPFSLYQDPRYAG